jgi:GNAT superfamily N-acetyltransferase
MTDPPPVAERDVITLRDGSKLVVRPIVPEDKAAIVAGFERMSPESRYRRFFAPLDRLSERDLAYLTEVDHHDHEALIGFDAATREPVGVARYIRSDAPTEAEVAVTVVDDWQGRGVATALLERLTARAHEEGITHFLALVLTENRDAIELFDHMAPDRSPPRRSASGHLELVIELPEPGTPTRESRLGRALRAAARGVLNANPWYLVRERIGRDNRPLR